MARPQKEGVDYFPLDVYLDKKLELIEAEFGLNGFGVVVKLWQEIYGERGYYIEWTNEVALLFAKKLGLGDNVVSEIVSASIRRGIFDKTLHDKHSILTSAGIQKRYFAMIGRRKKVQVKNEYLLINATDLPVNVHINGVNVDNNPKNDDSNPQSKGKKSKGKYSKEEPLPLRCISVYEQNINLATPVIFEQIKGYMDKGFEDEMICEVITEAVKCNKKSAKYIDAIMLACENEKTFTLEQFRNRQKRRTGKPIKNQAIDYENQELF